ncbi:hypothetical protein TNCV_3219831 [Trichonephila clavipes]|nr:hypothetical protein TNCV_3219831 [Trichonephila clavipes]
MPTLPPNRKKGLPLAPKTTTLPLLTALCDLIFLRPSHKQQYLKSATTDGTTSQAPPATNTQTQANRVPTPPAS